MAKRSKKKRVTSAGVVARVSVSGDTALRSPAWPPNHWIWSLILLAAVFLVYLPVGRAGYIWDDDSMITANSVIVGPLGLKQIWTTSAADICPLTLTTFWIEHALWGLTPLPYHLVTVFMHGGCAVLFWQVLRSLRVPGAWLGAALWALHPVQVESVAWIAETKNTQSGLFYLLSILFFLRWLRARSLDIRTRADWNYASVLIFALLAMTSKSSTVVLPVVLCLCAWRVEGRWHWRHVLHVAPVLMMSVGAGALATWTQKVHLATFVDPQFSRSWPERVVIAGDAVWFYLGKLLWPYPLVTIYPRWSIDAGRPLSYLPVAAVFVLLAILWLRRDSWCRPWFFVFAYFLIALLPVLGLIDNTIFSYSFVFDHFQYLPSMGPLALLGAGLARWADIIPSKAWLSSILSIGLLLILGLLSCRRALAYENQETIWIDTLTKNPGSWLAYNNLGVALLQKGHPDEALVQYQNALKIRSDYEPAHNNRGVIFLQKGELDKALAEFQTSLKIEPGDCMARYNLGLVLFQKGEPDQAIIQYQAALKINPDSAETHDRLGLALVQERRLDDGIIHYERALEINPDSVDAHTDLGNALVEKGQVEGAMAQFRRALEIQPASAGIRLNLGHAFSQEGKLNEAMEEYKKALKIDPGYAEAHNSLGSALAKTGRLDEAIFEFREALRLRPNEVEAQRNLAKAEAMAHRNSNGK
jgi:tetratricopeptide (TPR) repeat protein